MSTEEPERNIRRPLVIGVVGPCTAGKSTLIRNLAERGVQARHIAQEHSYVPYMWQRLTNPDVLIFLDVSYNVSMQRHKLNWTREEYLEQQRRLAHARDHANFYLMTDPFDEGEVTERILRYLNTLDGVSPRHSTPA
jgi:ABC-type Mn2+/Zn2+ transport system ATPase subunit